LPKPTTDKPADFIGFAGVDWWYHNRAHSDLQILTRLAREHKVLIVNSIGMRFPTPGKTSRPLHKIWRKLKSIARALRRGDPNLPNLYIYSPLPWPFYGTALSRRFSAWFVRMQVSLAARIVGIKSPVIFLTPPVAWPVAQGMKRSAVIYNRLDKHSLFKEANQSLIRQLEQELLSQADLTLYVNEALMTEEAALTSGRAMHLDHGVDSAHFDYQTFEKEPDDLAQIPKPRIGFFGNLRAQMVDFSYFTELATEIPEAQIVLIGDAQDSTVEMEGYGNIHLLGRKPYEEVPAYGAFFDVALLPYQENEWIWYCNPIKMKEYLALGLSVVSTDYPEARRFADRIAIASDRSDFITKVRGALQTPLTEDKRQALRASVAAETWDERTQRLVARVDVLKGK
jgi:glycosyltransferase involved in cell wall biosynthesis